MDWPREIAGHLIDRETGVEYEGNEQFHCVECGRTFDEAPDSTTLETVPCEPPALHEEFEDTRGI